MHLLQIRYCVRSKPGLLSYCPQWNSVPTYTRVITMINPGSQPNSDSCKEKCSGVEIRTGLEKPSLGLARQVGGRWATVLYQFSANNSESVCQGLRQITSLKPPSPLMACAWPMNWMSFSITFKDKREKALTPSPVIPSTSFSSSLLPAQQGPQYLSNGPSQWPSLWILERDV